MKDKLELLTEEFYSARSACQHSISSAKDSNLREAYEGAQNRLDRFIKEIKSKSLVQECAYYYLRNMTSLKGMDIKKIYDYSKDDLKIRSFQKIVRELSKEIAQKIEKRRSLAKTVLVLTASERLRKLKEQLKSMIKNNRLLQIQKASAYEIFRKRYKSYYFTFECWEDVDWNYYSRTYKYPKVTTYRYIHLIAINLFHNSLKLKTESVKQNTYNSQQKAMKQMIKSLTDRDKRFCKITEKIIDQIYLEISREKRIQRFEIMEFSTV